jgi:hypothetical protein
MNCNKYTPIQGIWVPYKNQAPSLWMWHLNELELTPEMTTSGQSLIMAGNQRAGAISRRGEQGDNLVGFYFSSIWSHAFGWDGAREWLGTTISPASYLMPPFVFLISSRRENKSASTSKKAYLQHGKRKADGQLGPSMLRSTHEYAHQIFLL